MKKPNLIYVRHNIGTYARGISSTDIKYYDLTLLIRGTLRYKINKQAITLNTGDLICIPPTYIREREAGSEKSDFISFNFTIDERLTLPLVLERAINNETLLLIAALDELNRYSYLDNKEKTEHLLSCLLLIFEDRIKQNKYNPLTLKIIEYIHANLASKITLDDIGRVTFFSPIYCDTVFKRETGKSIINYLLDARMTEAKRLLVEGSLSLSAVSELVGFDDYNYFSRVFKKRTGYTPSEYRKFSS